MMRKMTAGFLAFLMALILAAPAVSASSADVPVVFNPGEGRGSMPSLSVHIGDHFVLPECGFTAPQGQIFSHWEISGEDRYGYPGDHVLAADNMTPFGNQIIVTAKWKTPSGGPARVASAPAALSPAYTGEDLALVTAGQAENGTMRYALGSGSATEPDSGWSADIPRGKDAGTYYVWYRAAGDATHSDSASACCAAEIRKADPDVTPPSVNAGLVASGKAQELVSSGSASGGTMVYAVTSGNTAPEASAYSTSIPSETAAGTWYVWYKVNGDANHNDTAPASLSATISPAGGYTLTKAEGTEHVSGSDANAVFTVQSTGGEDKAYEKFTGVSVCRKAVGEDGYIKEKGSLILTLKSVYLNTLAAGEYPVTITFSDGSAVSSLTIRTPDPTPTPKPVPQTGDSGRPMLWLGLVLLGIVFAVLWGSFRVRTGKRRG